MQKVRQKVKQVNKVFAIALLASVLAIPLAIHTHAQDSTQPELEVVSQETTEEETPPAEETPPPANPEDIEEEDETPLPEEEEAPAPTEVDLAGAIAIAQAEHPGVEVVMAKVKLKNLEDKKVFKIVFVDGWRIYVRASDGEIVRIKDESNKQHECSKRGQQAAASWRKSSGRKWGNSFSHRKDFQHRKHGWNKPQPQQPVEQQPAEMEDVPAEQ